MDFQEFDRSIYRELGINLEAYKPAQLHRRIESLMNRLYIKKLNEFFIKIKTDSEIKQKFLDFITINVTEFFRNPEIFKDFQSIVKNEFLTKGEKLKIWSAACSIGCEPYSIAMFLNENSKGSFLKHKIIATDIDRTILKRAKEAIYSENEIKNISNNDLNKYFKKVNDKYNLEDSIKRMVEFRNHDLISDAYESDFDVIVCRNVVIYFNNDVKDKIYKNFVKSLKKGGILFVGATESIYNYRDYGLEKASTFIYRKL